MLVSIEKQTGKNLIGIDSIKDTPTDLLFAYNYALFVLSVKENLPSDYLPKDWQFLFEDEIQRCLDKYKESFKIDKDQAEDIEMKENILAEKFLRKRKES